MVIQNHVLKSYFLSQDEENVNIGIRYFISDQENELRYEQETSLTQSYRCFVQTYCTCFKYNIKRAEINTIEIS